MDLPGCVIDASTAVKLFLPEPYSNLTVALFSNFDQNEKSVVAVPDLFFAECANVFWKAKRRGILSNEHAEVALSTLLSLKWLVCPVSPLSKAALRLSLSLDISVYDASYVIAAHRLDVPLITADEKLVRRLDGTGHRLLWLGDLKV